MKTSWTEASRALQDIATTVFQHDESGIDLSFVNSQRGTDGRGRGQNGTGGIKVRAACVLLSVLGLNRFNGI